MFCNIHKEEFKSFGAFSASYLSNKNVDIVHVGKLLLVHGETALLVLSNPPAPNFVCSALEWFQIDVGWNGS